MEKVRVGVVGIGHLGNYHLQKYAKQDNCAITGVSDILSERVQTASERYGCPAFSDFRQLIGRVDAVSIAVPTRNHYEVAQPFLEAGIHVLLEKPITATLAEADTLVRLAEEGHLAFQIGFVERFNPAVIALGAVIQTPLFIEAHRLHPFFERGTDVDVILDLMIHDLDLILHFVKSPLRGVEAVGVPVLSPNMDIANARLTFENGCVANLTASRISGKTMQKIRFFGPEGYHAVDFGKRELISLGWRTGAEGQREIAANPVDVGSHDPLEVEIAAFLQAVRSHSAPPVTGREGRRSLELALRIVDQIRLSLARVPLPGIQVTPEGHVS